MSRYLLLLIFSFIININPARCQPTFDIKYHFRLFSEKGDLITCDILSGQALFVCTNHGILTKQEYDSASNYFYICIHTIWPVLTFRWNTNSGQMNFTINCPTEYKDIYLDSLYFSNGIYMVRDDCDKNVRSEDERSRHLVFRNYFPYKQISSDQAENEELIKLNCR